VVVVQGETLPVRLGDYMTSSNVDIGY